MPSCTGYWASRYCSTSSRLMPATGAHREPAACAPPSPTMDTLACRLGGVDQQTVVRGRSATPAIDAAGPIQAAGKPVGHDKQDRSGERSYCGLLILYRNYGNGRRGNINDRLSRTVRRKAQSERGCI